MKPSSSKTEIWYKCYLDPEGTFYVSAGCAGHRVGEMLDRAVDTGDLSFTTRPYRLVTDTVKVGSAYAEAGSLGSKDVGMPMFAVLKVDGGLLTYDWYVAETNGTATLFDTLRICKTGASPSDQPVSYIDADGEEKWKCVGEFDVVTAETRTLTNGWYVVKGSITIPEEANLTVNGTAHLILCDGAELTAGAITDGALVVYGQPSGCGALNVSGTVSASLTCEGGILSARTFAGDSLAVVGGTVMADQTDGAVTIDGGNVRTGACESQPKNGSGNIVHCVTVKCEGLVGSVSVEGLGGYGTNDIYPIGDWVYLWLPDGTYRFSLSDGETTSRYRAVVNGTAIMVAPLVPITPGTPVGPYTTPEEAESVANRAVVVPSTEVSEALGTDAARGTYCNMFFLDVVSTSDGKWAVAAGLTPEGWTNVALSVQAAARQILVADIAALEMGVETNVTVKGCGVPGFYYSFYSGSMVTNLRAVASEKGRNVLCVPDKPGVFSGVTKPSDAAGFFSVGVKETGDVQPSDRAILVPAPEKIVPVR